MRPFRNLLPILAVLGLTTLSAAPALAQGFTFGLRPEDPALGYFQYELAAGEKIDDAVLAVNGTKEPIRLKISRVAGHTGLTGGISFPGQADGPAQWISLPDEGTHEVPGEMGLRLPFTLAVPQGTPPGEYVAGFLATPDEASAVNDTAGGGFQVQLIPQMGVSVIVKVPGPERCEVTVRGLQEGPDKGRWKIILDLANTGNIHFKGVGAFVVRPAAGGDPVIDRPFNIGYFVPADAIGYPLYFDSLPGAGEYEAKVRITGEDCSFETEFSQRITITAEEQEQAEIEASQWAAARQSGSGEQTGVSLLVAAGIFLLGLAALLLVIFLLFSRRRRSKDDREREVQTMRARHAASGGSRPHPEDDLAERRIPPSKPR